NALAAHAQGSADCQGEVELIADFTRAPTGVRPGGRRRRRESSGSGHDVSGVRARRDPGYGP
ncbi:MAG TPA: hypothetical protein VFH80_27945, partial [Solirubrobacteraceae bacterium]|nr:hypothetical protein [Solirubrobacteraceae bacterium]